MFFRTTPAIGEITFVGATLWTDFDLFGDAEYAMMAAGETMNDYRKIRLRNYELRLRPAHTLKRHMESRDFIARELRKPGDFAARDAFQMTVLEAAGLGKVARELLDRANPTGSWARQPTEEPICEALAGNDPR
jgi:hypothetical protein